MTYAGLTHPNGEQDLHARWAANGGKQISDFFVGFYLFTHIPKSEYIIQTHSRFGM
jgi:hypothetical protein